MQRPNVPATEGGDWNEQVAGLIAEGQVASPAKKRSRSSGDENAPETNQGCSSRFKGVGWHRGNKKWRVEIRINGKTTSLGYFNDEEEAARKYDVAAAAAGKQMNFPVEGGQQATKFARRTEENAVKSKFKGVSWYPRSSKWKAQIMINDKVTHLGYFDSEKEAAHKYTEAAQSS
mmetsp:Transcript_10750/g.25135  ORF Transcript_10750/g.25135 Transcript_10750/m.25135 type:complete len:175 (-) Transcript_10750:171-695(-)